jgi:hypothetical protein
MEGICQNCGKILNKDEQHDTFCFDCLYNKEIRKKEDIRRTCSKCGNKLSLTEFYKHSNKINDYKKRCITCVKKEEKERYRKNRKNDIESEKLILKYEIKEDKKMLNNQDYIDEEEIKKIEERIEKRNRRIEKLNKNLKKINQYSTESLIKYEIKKMEKGEKDKKEKVDSKEEENRRSYLTRFNISSNEYKEYKWRKKHRWFPGEGKYYRYTNDDTEEVEIFKNIEVKLKKTNLMMTIEMIQPNQGEIRHYTETRARMWNCQRIREISKKEAEKHLK